MGLSFLNETGGVVYHVRAARSRARWAPFTRALALWLRRWSEGAEELVLIGPSAAWCLERDWLLRFGRLVCVDPDPLAELLFRLRVRHPRCEWVRQDFFSTRRAADLERLLGAHPRALVLFANFLGQLRLLGGEDDEGLLAFWRERLVPIVEGVEQGGERDGRSAPARQWASFHDRLSGALEPAALVQGLELAARPSDSELLKLCYRDDVRGELLDHGTEGFFPRACPHAYFAWPLVPGAWHLIEAVKRRS